MTTKKGCVIKHLQVTNCISVSMEEATFFERRKRIPKSLVRVDKQTANPNDAVTYTRRPKVISSGIQAYGQPYDVSSIEYEPDFPLPKISDEWIEDDVTIWDVPLDDKKKKDPAALLEQLQEEWKTQLEDDTARAREEGFNAGYAVAQQELETQIESAKTEFVEEIAHIKTAWEEYLKVVEPKLAALAFEIAETILDAPLPKDTRTLTIRTIMEAVEQLSSESSIEIILHPVDYLQFQENGVEQQLQAMRSGLRWHPNPDLKEGDWIVQSPTSTTRRLKAELIGMLKNQLGLKKSDVIDDDKHSDEAE